MSYNNRNYSTRGSQRYNTSGTFVSAGELGAGGAGATQGASPATPQRNTRSSTANNQSTANFASAYQSGNNISLTSQAPGAASAQTPAFNSSPPLPAKDDVKMEDPSDFPMDTSGSEGPTKPAWMKPKGVAKKVPTREKRRRQNESLRKLITPKNALMVLNEMLPGESITQQMSVEPTPGQQQFFQRQPGGNFCAGITIEGNTYQGYGENKMSARNAAAEQAIRALIIKRMTKAVNTAALSDTGSANGDGAAGAGAAGAGEVEETLPMIQLASFAIHKLFSEWEYEGHKVPQLRPNSANNAPEAGEQPAAAATPPKPRAPKPPKEAKTAADLPSDARTMHPCMLLTHMRPQLEYHQLGVEGDRPQNMLFTMGVNVDGTTYIGKATNKKEARKQAARAACTAIFNVQFDTV